MSYSYIIYDTGTGRIVRGRESDLEPDFSSLPPNRAVMAVPNAQRYVGTHKVVNGQIVPLPMQVEVLSAQKQRWREYPSAPAQLEMIWKALATLKGKPWPADVQAMIDQMAAVDTKYPNGTS